MAWTAPRTWSVSEVVTAAMMNAHVRDNLNYLKGVSGPTALDDRLTIPVASGTNGKGLRFASGANDFVTLQGLDVASNSYLFSGLNRYYDGTAYQQMNARAGSMVVQDGSGYWIFNTFAAASSTAVERLRMTPTGQLGIGTNAPAGPLHVVGGAVSGAGLAIGSVAAVTSLQTVFAAGTVARAAAIFYIDRNNTGGGYVSSSAAGTILLGGSITYVNSDTITIAVTAGGAMTAQRTVGTNGSHDIVIFAIFL